MYTRLDATLRELKVVNLLIAGVSTGACVESTRETQFHGIIPCIC